MTKVEGGILAYTPILLWFI